MFDLLNHDFVRYAFLAGTLVAIMAAVMGYFVVMRAQAFAADSLSHIGFSGATGAVLIGLSSLAGMFIMTIITALGMSVLGDRVRGRDVETGMVLAFALGLGVLFLNIYTQGATETVSILFGSILTVTSADLQVTVITGNIALLTITCIFRPLLFASIDPEVAQTRGVPTRLLSVLFLLLLSVTIAVSVQVVGVLLVFALLIAPAASAERVTRRPLSTLALSVVLALSYVWIGLFLGFVGPGRHLPISFYISALATLSYVVALIVGKMRTSRRVQKEERRDRQHPELPDAYIPLSGH